MTTAWEQPGHCEGHGRARWHLQPRHRLACCCKVYVEDGWWGRSKVETRACIAFEVLKKEFTKQGHLSSPIYWERGISKLPVCSTSKTSLIREPGDDLPVMLQGSNLWPHQQSHTFRNCESGLQKLQAWLQLPRVSKACPCLLFLFLYEYTDYFPYLIDSRSWN